MTAQQLKNSILQMAIQGKLAPQDPNDEPASVLLERIRAEKEEMIKEGKIKKEKDPSVIFRGADNLFYEKVGDQEPVCIVDEVPFDIPDSWEWTRFRELIFLVSGTSYNKKDVTPKGIRILRGGNIRDETVVLKSDDIFLPDSYYELEKTIHKGDVIFVASTGSKNVIGKPAKVVKNDFQAQIGAFLRIARPIVIDIIDYIWLIFQTDYYRSHIRESVKGTNINNIKANYVEDLLIPLPPFAEQKKIARNVNNIAPFIQQYNTKEHKLAEINHDFPDQLKKSILQMAVQGKLVPQDPNDEPAAVLLEKIRAEKEQLIQSGKIKRDKHESFIYRRDGSYYEKVDGTERCIDNEIPFDIPDGWEWVRLGNLIKLQSGTDFKPENYNDIGNGTPYITGASNIDEKGVIVNRWTLSPRNIANKGDVLLVCKGSGYGKTVICNINSAHIARQIMALKKDKCLNMAYIRYFLQSNLTYLKSKGQGVIPGIDRDSVLKMMFPLPPLSEQGRIVNKIEELLPIFNHL